MKLGDKYVPGSRPEMSFLHVSGSVSGVTAEMSLQAFMPACLYWEAFRYLRGKGRIPHDMHGEDVNHSNS